MVIYAPDGYQYGVMFQDGAVMSRWNGRTQREHAERHARAWAVEYAPDNIRAVRRLPGGGWVEYLPR